MFEEIISQWERLSDEKKFLVRKISLFSIGLYVLLQLVGFLIPMAIATSIGFWVYKSLVDKNPKVLR